MREDGRGEDGGGGITACTTQGESLDLNTLCV